MFQPIMRGTTTNWSLTRAIFHAMVIMVLMAIKTEAKYPNEIVEPPIVTCESDRIVIKVRTSTSNPSHIYAEDFHETPKCKVNYMNQIAIQHAECGMTTEHMDNPAGSMFRICISVQIHPFFVSDSDRSYCAQCVYMETNVVDDLAQNIAISEMTPSELKPQFDETSNAHCTYSIRKGSVDGSEVHAAVVGDSVFHVWQCDNDNIGILVQNCHVEDLQGDKILIIDQNGCGVDQYLFRTPEYTDDLNTAFLESNVFKFVDKAMTRFRCQLRLCVKNRGHGCDGITPPNTCPHFDGDKNNAQNTINGNELNKNKRNNKIRNNNHNSGEENADENRVDGENDGDDLAVVAATTAMSIHASVAGVSISDEYTSSTERTKIPRDGFIETRRFTALSSLRPSLSSYNDMKAVTKTLATRRPSLFATGAARSKATRQPGVTSFSTHGTSEPHVTPGDYTFNEVLSFDAVSAARAFAVSTLLPQGSASIGPPSMRSFGLSNAHHVVSGHTNDVPALTDTKAHDASVTARHSDYITDRARPPLYQPSSNRVIIRRDNDGLEHLSGYSFHNRNRRFTTIQTQATVARRVVKRSVSLRRMMEDTVHELNVVGLIRVLDSPEDLEYFAKERMTLSTDGDRLYTSPKTTISSTTTMLPKTTKPTTSFATTSLTTTTMSNATLATKIAAPSKTKSLWNLIYNNVQQDSKSKNIWKQQNVKYEKLQDKQQQPVVIEQQKREKKRAALFFQENGAKDRRRHALLNLTSVEARPAYTTSIDDSAHEFMALKETETRAAKNATRIMGSHAVAFAVSTNSSTVGVAHDTYKCMSRTVFWLLVTGTIVLALSQLIVFFALVANKFSAAERLKNRVYAFLRH